MGFNFAASNDSFLSERKRGIILGKLYISKGTKVRTLANQPSRYCLALTNLAPQRYELFPYFQAFFKKNCKNIALFFNFLYFGDIEMLVNKLEERFCASFYFLNAIKLVKNKLNGGLIYHTTNANLNRNTISLAKLP